jgi:predicted  nucleic acid-binding Zn-ribbon protein
LPPRNIHELQRKYDDLLERSAAERRRAELLLDEAQERAEASRVEARFVEMRYLAAQEQLAQLTNPYTSTSHPAL